MRFNPSFFQLKRSIQEANDFKTSVENANPERSWLKLCPNEVYNQYILLDEEFKTAFETLNLTRVYLCDINGNIIDQNIGYGFKKLIDFNCLYISFKILKDYGSQCLCLRFQFSSEGTGFGSAMALYSNLFTISSLNLERTSLITYKHKEVFYETPYGKIPDFSQSGTFNMNYSNQIRLPLYFKNWKTEQDSTENTYSTNTPTNINVGRVTRRKIKVWQTIGSDWINERLDVVTDTDYVYINGQREITRPYEYEETTNGSDFSVSAFESQPVYGDEYLDDYGLVNHRPVITGITFPNGSCCNPDGTPLIEPIITSEIIQGDTCLFEGVHKLITVQGQPNSTIKYRLNASIISGTAKQVSIYNNDISNNHIINNASNAFVGYFFLNASGSATLNIKCCLEECVPGQTISINANVELYQMDGIALSGQICNIEKSKNCPIPISPQWIINSESGANFKNVSILGEANSMATFRVLVLSTHRNGAFYIPNKITIENLLNVENVFENNEWEISVPIGSSGESTDFDILTTAGYYFNLPPPNPNIYLSFTLRDQNGDLSNQIIGLSHITNE